MHTNRGALGLEGRPVFDQEKCVENDLTEQQLEILKQVRPRLDLVLNTKMAIKEFPEDNLEENGVLNGFSNPEMQAKAAGDLPGFFDEQLESRFFDLDSYVKNLGSRDSLDKIRQFFSQFDREGSVVKEDELEEKYRDLEIIYLSLRNRILLLKEVILQIENKVSDYLRLEITMPKHGSTQLVYNAGNVWNNLVKH
ncbi:MAG: hypothetical protein US58_C0012G0012 [Candidatus Magasanikbacteria bacterium GW2011_GWA2_37_8]|uniref:Uncharacterized protein n=1 Tax=Candidatus Magasanikbacteria bacterium GW2011_GWA2_37_8 TaxID=1619036 RepID=A0A0G0HC81_9BACT|nr:MAG: hypothetical protein US58_C0012G0012 [Candidatus Magasanikbacteria bacterium GW2011_GWA2_37_8]